MFKKRLWAVSAAVLIIARTSLQQQLEQQPLKFVSNFSSSAQNMTKGAVISLSHGGGPMPVLGDPNHHDIVNSLKTRVPQILKLNTPEAPRAIVVVTAHWSTSDPTISSGRKPSLYYDYGGFPEEAYELTYDAPGSPEVAQEVYEALKEQNFNPRLDETRGWDHGVFIPLILIYPKADVPIVQLSVLLSEDPEEHLRMGAALRKLRDANVAVVGSGFPSFHNIRLLFSGAVQDSEFRQRNAKWNEVLVEAVGEKEVQNRARKLMEWRSFPGSYEMHPRRGAEHFMPMLVCAGTVSDGEAKSYSDEFMHLDNYSFYWS